MSHKEIPGQSFSLGPIAATRPSDEDGFDLTQFPGAARVDQWLVSIDIQLETTRASLDLATKTTNIDTVVQAKAPFKGVEGNGIQVAFVSGNTGLTGDELTSFNGGAIVVHEDLSAYTATVHFHDAVSTVAAIEAAITAQGDLIEVKTAGTAGHVAHVTVDEFALAHLTGGVDAATTFDIYVWGRHTTTKRWGLHNDFYGRVVAGKLFAAIKAGVQHQFIRDIGNYDRVAFTRDSGGTGQVFVNLTEILSMGVGN